MNNMGYWFGVIAGIASIIGVEAYNLSPNKTVPNIVIFLLPIVLFWFGSKLSKIVQDNIDEM